LTNAGAPSVLIDYYGLNDSFRRFVKGRTRIHMKKRYDTAFFFDHKDSVIFFLIHGIEPALNLGTIHLIAKLRQQCAPRQECPWVSSP